MSRLSVFPFPLFVIANASLVIANEMRNLLLRFFADAQNDKNPFARFLLPSFQKLIFR